MKNEHLHLLINEEIYVLDRSTKTGEVNQESGPATSEKVELAFLHNTEKKEELELLDKIVEACDLSVDFKIVKEGQSIDFKKAIIFSESAENFYEPLKSEQGNVLYSKPLNVLVDSKEEKGKLWAALKNFTAG